jgi:hypothetical protein
MVKMIKEQRNNASNHLFEHIVGIDAGNIHIHAQLLPKGPDLETDNQKVAKSMGITAI